VGVSWSKIEEKPPLKEKRINQKTTHIVGVGKPQYDVKLAIVNPKTNKRVSPNKIGEVWVSSESVSSGYYKDKKNTEKTFKGFIAPKNEGPFLKTGDFGFIDDSGELFITGRIKEIIIINGKNYYPYDIEHMVHNAHKGIPYNATAAIETKDGFTLITEVDRHHLKSHYYQEIIDAVLNELSKTLPISPSKIKLIKPHSLPKTTSGKIQRTLIKKQLASESINPIYTWTRSENMKQNNRKKRGPKNPIESCLITHLKSYGTSPSIYPDDTIYSLGIDSIQMTQISFFIEQEYTIQLELDDIVNIQTVADLAEK